MEELIDNFLENENSGEVLNSGENNELIGSTEQYESELLEFNEDTIGLMESGDVLGGRHGTTGIIYDKEAFEEMTQAPKRAYNEFTMGLVFIVGLIIIILSLILLGYKHFLR